jgi:hypothetical protein
MKTTTAAILLIAILAGPAAAQSYPDYTIRGDVNGDFRVTDDAGNTTRYMKQSNGSFTVDTGNQDGHYTLVPDGNGGFHVSNHDAQWGLPFVPPQQP